MIKLKKVLAAIVALSMVFALGGCKPTSNAGSSKTQTIDFYSDKAGFIDSMDNMASSLKAKTGITFKTTGYTDSTTYQTAIQQSIGGKSAPGLFTWWGGYRLKTLVDAGYLEDQTQMWKTYYEKVGVNPALATSLTFNGKIYAAPYLVAYETIYYNKTVFDKYGLKMPTNWAEFENVCNVLLANKITPIGQFSATIASFTWFQQMLGAYSPDLYKNLCNGSVKYTDPQVIEVMATWKKWIDAGYFAKPVQLEDMRKAFSLGQIGMMYWDNGTCLNETNKYGMKPGVDFGSFFLPPVNSSNKSCIFYEISPVCIAKNSSQKDAALKIMQNYEDPLIQQTMTDLHGFMITDKVNVSNPVLKNIIAQSNDSAKYELLLRYYENTPPNISDFAGNELDKFMNKVQNANTTLSNIQAKADTVWPDYKK